MNGKHVCRRKLQMKYFYAYTLIITNMGTMRLFRRISNTFKSLEPRGSYVYHQMWHQEFCALPAEMV